MFNKLFFLFLFIIINKVSFSQQSEKSIYVLYGHHLPTKYKVVSGQNNLIGRKNVFSAELGFNLDYTITDNWKLRTGISGHLLFLDEVSYGVSGPVPPGIPDQSISKYSRGLEYIESVSVGIPVKALYQFHFLSGNSVSVSGGPFIAIYFPASDEMAGMQSTQNGNLIRKYWVTRHFKNYKSDNSIGISYPQLEWDFDIQFTKKFENYGALNFGFKTHIGTRRLERATFVIWPDEPDYKSEGYFILNRSYIGLFAGFALGRNKP